MIEWVVQCVTTTAFTINVNGDRVGFFKGARGLRQGGPISPYLFTLIMEIFTLILKRRINSSNDFQYHFGCKEMEITHVCFADDLLVMCHGDILSVQVIKDALEEFNACSGRLPNLSKSTIFFCSMKEIDKQAILHILPFMIGKLPVKYLGVPLIAKRLGIADCKSLVDKIRKKVTDWRNKSRSYAGRLQLVAAVLESIHVYQASVILLPVNVISEINRLLKEFFWNQGKSAKGKCKVAWKDVCCPKDQGGLGLKDLYTWNEAFLSKHVWIIAINKDTLWVKWIHTVKLRGKNFWNVEVDLNDS